MISRVQQKLKKISSDQFLIKIKRIYNLTLNSSYFLHIYLLVNN